MQFVVFKIGKGEYGFEIKDVQEIVRLQEVTKMPNMPEYMEGVVNLRGKVIPVISLAKKFKLNCNEESDATRLIVLNINDNQQMAIKVDEVTEVLNIKDDQIDQAPNVTNSSKEHCLKGIAKVNEKLILLLVIEKIITATELPQVSA